MIVEVIADAKKDFLITMKSFIHSKYAGHCKELERTLNKKAVLIDYIKDETVLRMYKNLIKCC